VKQEGSSNDRTILNKSNSNGDKNQY